MLTFPNAKINLGLNITEKRPDGYHNLETIFYPVPIEDALEINILNEGKGKFRLHQAGLEIEGEAENNLVVKAYKLLDDLFFHLTGFRGHMLFHILYRIGQIRLQTLFVRIQFLIHTNNFLVYLFLFFIAYGS